MSTIKITQEELKEVAQTIYHHIVNRNLKIKFPDDYSFLYNDKKNKEKYELQGIYLFNLFNRINNINTLAYAVRYSQTLEIEETYQYIEGLGDKYFSLKELYKKIDSILYNLDDYATQEVLNVLNSIKEQISYILIYYGEEDL